MADFNAEPLHTTTVTGGAAEGSIGRISAPQPGSGGATFHYKMRAEANPAPGYEVWVVTGTPDFLGTSAPGAITAGTAVVVSEWTT